MIHFDTNALVALPQWAREANEVVSRVVRGEAAAVCAVVWYEFLLGPLIDDEAELAHAFIGGRIEPQTAADAELGARLFYACGRHRTLKIDALIAATVIRADADFVTMPDTATRSQCRPASRSAATEPAWPRAVPAPSRLPAQQAGAP